MNYDCNMSSLAERVRDRRTQLELSQEGLAKTAKVSQSTIAHIESGRNQGTKHVVALALALRVTPEWLVDGVGGPPRPGLAHERLQKIESDKPAATRHAADISNAPVNATKLREVPSEEVVSVALKSLRVLVESTSPLFHKPLQEEIAGFLAGKRSAEEATSTLIALHQASRSMPTSTAGLLETDEIVKQSVENKRK